MIVRPLWATYIVTSEQNPSGIVISEPNKIRKWVVEKFYGISPGLLCTALSLLFCFVRRLSALKSANSTALYRQWNKINSTKPCL